MDERRYYRGGFVWPIVLIGAGVVFLLNTLGVLSWDVWQTLLRLWPVLLIAVGLDILVGRRFPLGSALLALLLVGVLALAVRGSLPMVASATVSPNVDRTETISQTLDGAQSATASISFGSGTLNIGSLAPDSGSLIEGTVDLSRGETVNKVYLVTGNNGAYTLASSGSWSSGPEWIGDPNGKSWDLNLNRDIPLDLKVNAGAGRSMLDLTNLNLQRLTVDGGVGQVQVKLPAQGVYDVRVEGGVGQLILMAPQGLAVRAQVDKGLGGVTTKGNWTQRDDTYTTGDTAGAANRATVVVNGGVGNITLQTISE